LYPSSLLLFPPPSFQQRKITHANGQRTK
jgi:hypothetical protein